MRTEGESEAERERQQTRLRLGVGELGGKLAQLDARTHPHRHVHSQGSKDAVVSPERKRGGEEG